MCPSANRVSSPPDPDGGGGRVKPALKPSLDRWGCVCKISSRSIQGFGFPSALHIPTESDRQTNIFTPIFIWIYYDNVQSLLHSHKLILKQPAAWCLIPASFTARFAWSADQAHHILIFDPTIGNKKAAILSINSSGLILFLIGNVITEFASQLTHSLQTTASDSLTYMVYNKQQWWS